MDPLGARSHFLDVQTLPTWPQQLDQDGQAAAPEPSEGQGFPSPFPFRADINAKIVLFKGDVALLNCTSIVNTSSESLNDKNPVSDSIHRLAGPELRDELLKLKGCRTGEAKLTKGFGLAARFIIHTVGPKYKTKYRTAAESSLYSCYRSVLQLVVEQSMASVGLCTITTSKRGYPLEEATHMALRTVRRFLEKHGSGIEAVVFAASDAEEVRLLPAAGGDPTGPACPQPCVCVCVCVGGGVLQPIYRKLLPLYFPRSEEEERACRPLIPADIGNSEGEPIVPERQIRISEKPGVLEDGSSEENLDLDLDLDLGQVGTHAFARMEGDVDKQRKQILQGQVSEAAAQKQHQRNYSRWLCRARAEDLSDIAALKALYQTGVDMCGRTVMVVVGRNIPVTLLDPEKALLYFIHVMDHITAKEYVMVYFHTLTAEHNHLHSDFLRNLHDIVDYKFKKNLKAFYFVHPTFRSKVSTWFFTTFSVSGLKEKVRYLDSLHQLFTCIRPEQIDIPPFVLEYDARVNGPPRPDHASGL